MITIKITFTFTGNSNIEKRAHTDLKFQNNSYAIQILKQQSQTAIGNKGKLQEVF